MTKKKTASKPTKASQYDLEKQVMLALVVARPLHRKLTKKVLADGVSMKAYVTSLIEKAVAK